MATGIQTLAGMRPENATRGPIQPMAGWLLGLSDRRLRRLAPLERVYLCSK